MTTPDDLNKRKATLSEARRALLLKRLKGKKPGDLPATRIEPQSQDGLLPLSYTQQRVWFIQQLYPDNRAYNMNETWRLRGSLDEEALRQALQKIVQRHAALRTYFVAGDEAAMQTVALTVDLPFSITDISHLSSAAREETVLQMVLAEGNHAFDLSQAPLFRASLIRLADDEHILQLVLHHIITDEWSNDIIWRELAFYYDSLRHAGVSELAQSAIQYTDYARWQREQVDSGALEKEMDYWQRQLSGDLPLLQLPTDRPRPAEQSLQGGIVQRMLPAELLHGIQSISQQTGATLFITLLAAFQALLYRYSGQKDILVGTPIANRQRAETENVVGMFINTAVIRAKISDNMTFGALLDQVQKTVLDALANQDLPFDLLVQAMDPDRDLSYNPLFQTMFVFRSDSVERSLPGIEFEPIKVDRSVSKFDLTLFAGEEDGQLMSAMEYSVNLFEETTVQRMLDHWQVLLEGIIADPQAPIATLPMLNAVEREWVIKIWNETDVPLRKTSPLHTLIAEQAARQPQAEAVISAEERLTYGELENKASGLARRLVARGVKTGTPVGLFAERSAAMVVGILGILKAGGAYVPLEPAYPTERVAYALEDTGAAVIAAQAHLVGRLPATDAAIVIIDADPGAAMSDTAPLETAVSLDDLAYIIHTSGSTGTPKGVMVNHRNLLASTLAREVTYEEVVGRYLLLSSFAFDSSVAGIFWTLATGGALVLPGLDEEKDVQKLATLIAAEQVTHTLALPTLYRLLLDYAPAKSLESLQVVIVAGEACPPDLSQKHYPLLPGCALYNEYGPTEATVWCSVYRLPKESDEGPVPIGRPIANSQLYILDDRQQPLPVGVPGELYVGGAGVTPGYWQNPELTTQRFPTLDFIAQEQNSRVYRTGDLARWRADGEVEFLGRVDNQVKIRGFRIELGEIEALLLQHPDVEEAAVTVWEQPGVGASQDRSLVAYIAGEQVTNGTRPEGAQLQTYLSQRLPEYMVPRNIVGLPTLPRTPNGKIDRNRLPQPKIERDRQKPFVAPRSGAEEKLARIWCEILRLPKVSVEDKFFELGGDSIMTIQVIARARQEGLVLTPRQLFQEQTIARLAAVAQQDQQLLESSPDISGAVPLTPIQHWFFAQRLTQAAHWNQAAWFETDAELNLAILQQALAALVVHHPMLRARFQQFGGEWQQEVIEGATVPAVEQIDLAGLGSAAQDEALLATANNLHATLDLSQPPLLRGAWFDLGAGRPPRLLLTIHHLVVDAVSWGILLPDLVTAYTQLMRGDQVLLPPATTSYLQWAVAQARWVQGEKMQGDAQYWRETGQLATHLPQDGAGGRSNKEGEANLVTVKLDGVHTDQLLREAHLAYHTRIDDLLLAALVKAVSDWSGQQSLLLALERHGREDIDPQLDLSRTVGWFTSLFPMFLILPDERDAGAYIRAVKEQLRAVPHNGVSYGILRYLGDKQTQQVLAQRPQPEMLFNYLGVQRAAENGTEPIRPLRANTGQLYGPENGRAHLLDVNARVENGLLTARWQYAPAHFQQATIKRVAETFIQELVRLIDHCLAVEQSRHTPSDFPLADLRQDDLDSLSDLLSGLE